VSRKASLPAWENGVSMPGLSRAAARARQRAAIGKGKSEGRRPAWRSVSPASAHTNPSGASAGTKHFRIPQSTTVGVIPKGGHAALSMRTPAPRSSITLLSILTQA
jgi:hypothetical protein